LLAQQYAKGKALEVATMLEIDAVINPCDTRKTIANALS
jgi:acetyl-CoA carboxylase carboxyltransferase component